MHLAKTLVDFLRTQATAPENEARETAESALRQLLEDEDTTGEERGTILEAIMKAGIAPHYPGIAATLSNLKTSAERSVREFRLRTIETETSLAGMLEAAKQPTLLDQQLKILQSFYRLGWDSADSFPRLLHQVAIPIVRAIKAGENGRLPESKEQVLLTLLQSAERLALVDKAGWIFGVTILQRITEDRQTDPYVRAIAVDNLATLAHIDLARSQPDLAISPSEQRRRRLEVERILGTINASAATGLHQQLHRLALGDANARSAVESAEGWSKLPAFFIGSARLKRGRGTPSPLK